MCISAFCFTAIASLFFTESPVITIQNNNPSYSLLNSIHFHPSQNIFCTTYTHNNKIYLYKIDDDRSYSLLQVLSNPQAKLHSPQHAAFSPDGNLLIVVNWMDRSLNVYRNNDKGLFTQNPVNTIASPRALVRSKPHGIAFSPSGHLLAIAYGASSVYKNAIALFACEGESLSCIDILKHTDLIGIPKGICFTPDSNHLLVSFAEPSCLQIFSIQDEKVIATPLQTLIGPHTGLSRPEDVKIAPDGSYCAATNSSGNTVTFYLFNPLSNQITDSTPFWTLQNPDARLFFPHGIDFSYDSQYLAITQFGAVETTPDGNVHWDSTLLPKEGAIQIYLLH